MESIENLFLYLGIGSGDYGDIQRFLFGAALSSVILFTFKPKILFLDDGSPKQWNLLAPKETNSEFLTKIPWWSVSLFFGFLMGIVI